MFFRHEISILCILVIVFQIAQCRSTGNNNDDEFKNLNPAPPGFHYERLVDVRQKVKSGAFKIQMMSPEEVKQMARNKQTTSKPRRSDGDERGNEPRNVGDHDDDNGKHDGGGNDGHEGHNGHGNKKGGTCDDDQCHVIHNTHEHDGGGDHEKGHNGEDHDLAGGPKEQAAEAMEENSKHSNHEGDHEGKRKGEGNGKRKQDEDYEDALDDGNAFEVLERSAAGRKKRDFPLKLPFTSSGEPETVTAVEAFSTTEAVSTTDGVTNTESVTTTTTEAVSATDSTDGTTITETKAVATTVDSSGNEEVTEVTAVTTSDNDGLFGGIHSGVMQVVSMGQNMKTNLVMAAPYMPMVWKVAQFLVPGLSQYQMLMLTMSVATTTADVLKRNDDGQSMSSIITDAAKNALWQSIISKRDDGFSVSDYAINIYENMKTHARSIPRYFYGDKSSSSATGTLDEMTYDIENIGTEMNSVIPGTGVTENPLETNAMTENLKKIMDMKNHVHHSGEGSMSGSDGIDGDEINIADNIEVDTTLFNRVLESSMKLQPEFVQKMSGGELVEYLNNMNIPSVVDSKPVFDALTSQMDLDDSVTVEQKTKLSKSLGRITDYFISKGLEAKEYVIPS